MKHFAVALSLTTAPIPVLADMSTQKDRDAVCEEVATMAYAVMSLRQNGGSLSDTLSAAEADYEAMGDVPRRVVLDAFERPRYNTFSIRLDVADTFRDDWHLKCLRANE